MNIIHKYKYKVCIVQIYQYLHHAYLQITKSKYAGIEDLQMATGYWDQEICDLVNHIIVGGTWQLGALFVPFKRDDDQGENELKYSSHISISTLWNDCRTIIVVVKYVFVFSYLVTWNIFL